MPVLSPGVVARTFGPPAACCCCCCCCLLLLLLKRVAQPWTLKGGVKPRQGKPSSVITHLTFGLFPQVPLLLFCCCECSCISPPTAPAVDASIRPLPCCPPDRRLVVKSVKASALLRSEGPTPSPSAAKPHACHRLPARKSAGTTTATPAAPQPGPQRGRKSPMTTSAVYRRLGPA